AHHHLGQGQRIDLLAAVRILVVDEAVAVVVLTIAADLGDVRVPASTGAAGADASATPGPAAGTTAGAAPTPSARAAAASTSATAGPAPGPRSPAALDGCRHAAPRNAAHVGRAWIGIVAVRRRGAAGTARRGLAAAHTGIARVGRARIAVVAVGVGLAGQAVSNWLVRADMARGGTG